MNSEMNFAANATQGRYKALDQQTFGQWVKQTREAQRMTKTECAIRAEVSIQRWAQIEYDVTTRKDNRPPRIERETAEWVARGLRVDSAVAYTKAKLLPDVPPLLPGLTMHFTETDDADTSDNAPVTRGDLRKLESLLNSIRKELQQRAQ